MTGGALYLQWPKTDSDMSVTQTRRQTSVTGGSEALDEPKTSEEDENVGRGTKTSEEDENVGRGTKTSEDGTRGVGRGDGWSEWLSGDT